MALGIVDTDLLRDKIYEAAAIAEEWPQVLQHLADLSAGAAAALFAYDEGGIFRYVTTPSYRPMYDDYVANGGFPVNPRPRRALSGFPMSFAADVDLCTAEELATDPAYVRFLRPHGFEWTVGTAIPVPTGDFVGFDIARTMSMGPFRSPQVARLNAYRPSLARAGALAQRLNLRTARDQRRRWRRWGSRRQSLLTVAGCWPQIGCSNSWHPE